MKHGSLFSGIGGFDLAAEWMGWENVFHCEKNKFRQVVLKYYWQNTILHEDITTTDFRVYRGRVDILTGGDPCQPHSLAGKRTGKEDQRYLWPQYKRAITEILPKWIVNENVPGSISNGILDEKISDIETLGYAWWPPVVIPACAVGANHKRERVWLIAYNDDKFGNLSEQQRRQEQEKNIDFIGDAKNGTATNFNKPGLPKRIQGKLGGVSKKEATFQGCKSSRIFTKGDWEQFPTQSPVWDGTHGIYAGLDTSTFSKKRWRTESIMAGGDAIVPQVAYEIFKAIELSNQTLAI